VQLSSCRGQNCRVQAMHGDGGHAMSLIRNGFAVSCTRRGLLGAFSALLALAVFDLGAATAQEAKQIKLTDKHIQGFMAASKDMGKLYANANPDKPDPKVEAQAAAIAKKNGFASLDEYDDASMNISILRPRSSPSRPNRSRMRSRRSRPTNPSRRRKRRRTWRNSRRRSRPQSPFGSRKTSRWC